MLLSSTQGRAVAPNPTSRIIRDVSRWRQLEPHWDRLLEATPQATPWQSWEYLHAWWQHLAGDRQLWLVVVERGGIPCLILPLQIGSIHLLGLTCKVLEPIGMPDDINRPRLGIGPPDGGALQCALEAIWCQRRDWDVLRLDEKCADDPEVDAVRQFAASRRLLLRIQPLHPCPYLNLKQYWPDYLNARGRRLAKNLRASRRRLEAMGPIRMDKAASPMAVDQAFGVLLAIQSRSWKHQAGIGLSASAEYRNFVRRFIGRMARRSAARVLILYCGDKPIAGTIAVTDRDTYYSAHIVHDRDYDQASPGTLLESMEIEQLMQEKRFTSYDFLGAALNNKRRWTDDALATCRILLLRPTPANRVMDAYLFGIKPRIRRLLRLLATHRLNTTK